MKSFAAGMGAPVLLLALAACHSDKPEDKVKAAFDTCVKAVEAGDAATVAEQLDPQFQGPEGLDRAGVRFYLMGVFRQGPVGVTVLENRVKRNGPEIWQTVGLVLTQKGSGLLPDASRRNYLIHWRERKGEWRMVEVQEAAAQP